MSQPFHLVKDVLDGLREKEMLRKWAADQQEYFKKSFEMMAPAYRETIFRDGKEQARWDHVMAHLHKFFIKSPLLIKEANGILFSFFGSDIKQKYWIFPTIYSRTDYESEVVLELLYFYIRIYDQASFVNLGRVKEYVDKRIELKE